MTNLVVWVYNIARKQRTALYQGCFIARANSLILDYEEVISFWRLTCVIEIQNLDGKVGTGLEGPVVWRRDYVDGRAQTEQILDTTLALDVAE